MRKFLFLLVDEGDENVGIYSRLLGLQYGTVSSRSAANPGNCTCAMYICTSCWNLQTVYFLVFIVHLLHVIQHIVKYNKVNAVHGAKHTVHRTVHNMLYTVNFTLLRVHPVHSTNYCTHFTIVRFTFILHCIL